MTEIWLIRHGQASFGTDDYDRLTAIGWEQARLLGEYLRTRQLSFDAVFTGTLRRHRETLAGIQEALAETPTATQSAGLNEYDFDDLARCYLALHPDEGFAPGDARSFYRMLRKALLLWSEDALPDTRLRWPDFLRGQCESLDSLTQSGAERVLVVSSGGPISGLVREVLALSPEHMINLNLQIANTSISRFISHRGKHRLASFNNVPHLDHPDTAHLITYS